MKDLFSLYVLSTQYRLCDNCQLHTRSEVSSKHLFQVRLEILSRSVENMASHLLTKYNP